LINFAKTETKKYERTVLKKLWAD